MRLGVADLGFHVRQLFSLVTSHKPFLHLILQMVLSNGGVWPQIPSRFSNVIKGVACAQTSIHLRMQVKYPQVVYACVSLSFSVAVLKVVVSLLQCQIGKIVT